jgi:hypothetical protein
VAALRDYWGVSASRAVPVFGDLTSKKLGVSSEDVKKLKGQVDHFLPPGRRLRPGRRRGKPGRRQHRRHAQRGGVRQSHRRRPLPPRESSIAAAGLYEGVFREDMFEEAENTSTRTS